MKIFDQRIFLKHQSVLQRNIMVQSDKNFSPEKRDTPKYFLDKKGGSYLKNIFESRDFLKQRMVFRQSFFGPVRKKILKKLWSFPPRLLEKFRYQNPFETQKGFSTNFIGTVRQRIFNGIQWYPLFMHKNFDTRKFCDTTKCSPT